MKTKLYLLFILFSSMAFSQSTLNDYEMAYIPVRFKFQKEDNQFRLNTTIKAFLKQKGFEAYLSGDVLPEGFLDYNCNKVFVNVVEENTTFVTKLKVEFRDCKDAVLFVTDLGESRIKEYTPAHNEALVKALKSFDKAKYKFSGKTYFDEEAQLKLKGREVENISEEVTKVIKSEKEVKYEKVQKTPKTEDVQLVTKVINQATKEELVLRKTSSPDVYLCSRSGKNGVALSKDGVWYFEYYQNEKLISEEIDIKF